MAANSSINDIARQKNKGIVVLPTCTDSISIGDSTFFLKYGASSVGGRHRNRGDSQLRIEPVEYGGDSKAGSFNAGVEDEGKSFYQILSILKLRSCLRRTHLKASTCLLKMKGREWMFLRRTLAFWLIFSLITPSPWVNRVRSKRWTLSVSAPRCQNP